MGPQKTVGACRALAIDEKSFGPDHPDVASNLNNWAQLLTETNRLAKAAPLMRRALTIDEKSYGPDHPSVARDPNNLADLLKTIYRMAEAEPLYRRALAITERSYGTDHPGVAGRDDAPPRIGGLCQSRSLAHPRGDKCG
jgi:tetratricopeptide (TPR) repeat protein